MSWEKENKKEDAGGVGIWDRVVRRSFIDMETPN